MRERRWRPFSTARQVGLHRLAYPLPGPMQPDVQIRLSNFQDFADLLRLHSFHIAENQDLFQGSRQDLDGPIHRLDCLLGSQEFLRRLVIPRLWRNGPMTCPLTGSMKPGWIDGFVLVIVEGLER